MKLSASSPPCVCLFIYLIVCLVADLPQNQQVKFDKTSIDRGNNHRENYLHAHVALGPLPLPFILMGKKDLS